MVWVEKCVQCGTDRWATPMTTGKPCQACEQGRPEMAPDHDGVGRVRCEVAVPTLREWADADHPPSLLTWHREFVPALRSLLDLLDAAEGYASTVRRWQDDPMLASDLLDAESVLCNAAIQASQSGSDKQGGAS